MALPTQITQTGVHAVVTIVNTQVSLNSTSWPLLSSPVSDCHASKLTKQHKKISKLVLKLVWCVCVCVHVQRIQCYDYILFLRVYVYILVDLVKHCAHVNR